MFVVCASVSVLLVFVYYIELFVFLRGVSSLPFSDTTFFFTCFLFVCCRWRYYFIFQRGFFKDNPFFFGGNIFSVCSEAKLCLLFVARDVSLPFFHTRYFFVSEAMLLSFL